MAELVDRLSEGLHAPAPDNEEAWKQKARHRLVEIENATVQAVDGENVSARIRPIVGR